MITRNYMGQNHQQSIKTVQRASAPTFLYSEVPAVHRHHHQTAPNRLMFSAPSKIHQPSFTSSSSSSKINHYHLPGPNSGHIEKSNFRASQPIPLVDGTDMLAPSNFKRFPLKSLSDFDSIRSENKHSYVSAAASSAQLRKKRPHQRIVPFTEESNSSDDDWSPAAQPISYPKQRYLAAENLQYRQQERISFYPDTNPEYFQTYKSTTAEPTTTTTYAPKTIPKYTFFKAESKYQSVTGTTESPVTSVKRNPYIRRKYRTKKPITFTPDAENNNDNDGEAPWTPTTSGYNNNNKDDVKPVVEYANEDSSHSNQLYGKTNDDNHAYGSIFISSTVSSPFDNNESLFVTPLGESSSEASPTIDDVDITPKSTVRKNKRVFRRKLVASSSASTNPDSCESSCLANVVSRDYDPVCGSDSKSYANIGRLRCTKICGDHRKS